jgi:uncharacterized membrane protein
MDLRFLTGLLGAGVVGAALKLKGLTQWIGFLVLWLITGTLVYLATGIHTHLAYYLGLEKEPRYL